MHPGSRHWQFSLDEYLVLEQGSELKHEFVDGSIYAMGGGTPEHAAMAMRIGAALIAQLRGRRCNVYSSDLRVRIAAVNVSTYPDVTVICGEAQRDALDPLAVVNPTVLIEVTSQSSEAYDRGDKLEYYQQIPSVRDIVIVSHRERSVEVWRRAEDGWKRDTAAAGEVALLSSIDCSLSVDEIYLDPLAS